MSLKRFSLFLILGVCLESTSNFDYARAQETLIPYPEDYFEIYVPALETEGGDEGYEYVIPVPEMPSAEATPMPTYVPSLEDTQAKDTDYDGLSDEIEAIVGSDPEQGDSDGDGLLDGFEVKPRESKISGLVTSDPTQIDTDQDGLPDSYEQAIGTDPRHFDTDGDGRSDAEEVMGAGNVFDFDS